MAEIDVALRGLVRLRAGGRCEYCLVSDLVTLAEHEIDHVIALKHGGLTVLENLALCCAVCNRYKGSYISSLDPEDGQLTPLFNPRTDLWENHLHLEAGAILPLTPTGRVTVKLLRMNLANRVIERRSFDH